MFYAAELETMRKISPVGGHFKGSSGAEYEILGFEHGLFRLRTPTGEEIDAVTITSGPRVDFFSDGEKIESLSHADAFYVRPQKQGTVAA